MFTFKDYNVIMMLENGSKPLESFEGGTQDVLPSLEIEKAFLAIINF
jgi:hypothetical protein